MKKYQSKGQFTRSMKSNETNTKKKKKMSKKEIRDIVNKFNVCVTGKSERGENSCTEIIFEEIRAKTFPNLVMDITPLIKNLN